jgi:hypothetical protein
MLMIDRTASPSLSWAIATAGPEFRTRPRPRRVRRQCRGRGVAAAAPDPSDWTSDLDMFEQAIGKIEKAPGKRGTI